MISLLTLFLLTRSPNYFADDHYCKEIVEILRENVRDGYISVLDARKIANRCSKVKFDD